MLIKCSIIGVFTQTSVKLKERWANNRATDQSLVKQKDSIEDIQKRFAIQMESLNGDWK